MKALGCREAKRNVALPRTGGVEPRNGGGEYRGDLARTLAGREFGGEGEFDGHVGIHEVVQTVRDNMTEERSDLTVWA